MRSTTHSPTFRIREAKIGDISDLLGIQTECYKEELIEDTCVFESMVDNGLSLVACAPGGCVIGYLLAHTWHSLAEPPKLHVPIGRSDSECIFLHDMAVLPRWQGKGVASMLFDGFNKSKPIGLVAVNGAQGFWKKKGFVERECRSLESYGDGAVYMTRSI